MLSLKMLEVYRVQSDKRTYSSVSLSSWWILMERYRAKVMFPSMLTRCSFREIVMESPSSAVGVLFDFRKSSAHCSGDSQSAACPAVPQHGQLTWGDGRAYTGRACTAPKRGTRISRSSPLNEIDNRVSI